MHARKSCPTLLRSPGTLGLQASLSMGCSSINSKKNTLVGCHFLCQKIFPTQGSNLSLLLPCTGGQVLYTSAIWEALTYLNGPQFKDGLYRTIAKMVGSMHEEEHKQRHCQVEIVGSAKKTSARCCVHSWPAATDASITTSCPQRKQQHRNCSPNSLQTEKYPPPLLLRKGSVTGSQATLAN